MEVIYAFKLTPHSEPDKVNVMILIQDKMINIYKTFD